MAIPSLPFCLLIVGLVSTGLSKLQLPQLAPEEFARLHRPLLRFDGSAEDFCFPDTVWQFAYISNHRGG